MIKRMLGTEDHSKQEAAGVTEQPAHSHTETSVTIEIRMTVY